MQTKDAAAVREGAGNQHMLAWIEAAVAPWHRPVLALAAIVYAAFAVMHVLAAPPHIAALMTPLAGLTSGAAITLYLAERRIPERLRRRVFCIVGAMIATNSSAHLLFELRPELSTNVAVAIMACAIFLIRIEEFAGLTLCCIGAFAVAVAAAPASSHWFHFGVHLAECFIVATVLFTMKRSICRAAANARDAERAMRHEAETTAAEAHRLAGIAQANAVRAERMSAAKSDFLANMSHELRTPLNAIIGFSDLLKSIGPASPKAPEYADYVHRSGVYLLDLIDHVLDLSNGAQNLVETRFSLDEILGTALSQHRADSETRSIRLSAAPAPGIDLIGDPKKFSAILSHLVSNAVKFTPQLGKVTVNAILGEDGALNVIVTDDGIGIAEADLERVFEPFCQADSDYAKRYQGMGLGLAIARQYARAHGGDVVLASVPGQGTSARVFVPAERVRPSGQQRAMAG